MSRLRTALVAVVLTCILSAPAWAQNAAATDSLKAQLAAIAARLDSLQRNLCPAPAPAPGPMEITGNPTTDSLAASVRRLNAQLEQLRASRCGAGPAAAPAADTSAGDDLAAIRAAAAAAGAGAAAGGAAGQPAKADTQPTQFVGKQRNASVLNPEISATGDIRFTIEGQGEQRDNFIPREFEVGIQSTLDPYASAKIFLTFSPDEVGVEEGYLYWTGLPGKVRADFGKFREQVGDLNRWHLHALPETEYPQVYRQYFGNEGLSGTGISLYTVLPVSLGHGTHEIWFQTTTTSEDAFLAGSNQPVVLGRLQNFWQLSKSSYFQLGFTALSGVNGDSGFSGRVLGADIRYTWRPPRAGTRQNLTLRAEGYQAHSNASGVTTDRYGTYVDLLYQASRRWIFGARYDYVQSPLGPESTLWQVTPTITWWESEFVYLRLEGQHQNSSLYGDHDALTLQAVFAMGPHKHETY